MIGSATLRSASLVSAGRHRFPRRGLLLVAMALSVALATQLVGLASAPPQTPATLASPRVELPAGGPALAVSIGSRERIDGAIAVWTGNLERDAGDFIAAIHLGELYLARAAITGQAADFDRARQAAERALSIDGSLVGARLLHAQAAQAAHDFAAAAAEAEALLADQPGLAQAQAILGDAYLELGNYAGAAEAYGALSAVTSPAVIARGARLAAVTGSLADARQLAADALRLATDDPAADGATLSWYHLLAGALAFQAGDLPAARGAYESALAESPASPAAAAGLARTLASLGEDERAIELYEQAVTTYPLPETLAALGDLYALTGRPDEAATRYEQVRAIAAIDAETGLYSRGVVLFMANHVDDPARAVELARADLGSRPDVYGWDAYAWALYAAGDYAAAREAIATARASDTEDALLDYHAGMIAIALGESADGQVLLEAALARNPAFDPLQAKAALAALESAKGGD